MPQFQLTITRARYCVNLYPSTRRETMSIHNSFVTLFQGLKNYRLESYDLRTNFKLRDTTMFRGEFKETTFPETPIENMEVHCS